MEITLELFEVILRENSLAIPEILPGKIAGQMSERQRKVSKFSFVLNF